MNGAHKDYTKVSSRRTVVIFPANLHNPDEILLNLNPPAFTDMDFKIAIN